jgi:hypothetical protein
MTNFKTILLIALFSALAVLPASAQDKGYNDTILTYDGQEYTNVKVVDENFEECLYQSKLTGGQSQPVPMSNVKEVIYGRPSYDYDRGKEAYDGEKYDKALQLFSKAADRALKGKAPEWTIQYSLFYKGQCELILGDSAGALDSFQTLLSKKENTKFLLDVANAGFDAYVANGDADGAADWIEKDQFKGQSAFRERYNYLKARLSEQRKQYGEAQRAYSDLASGSDDPSVKEEATLGNLRMLRYNKVYGQIQGIAEDVIDDDEASYDMKGAAWCALGDYLLNEADNASAGPDKAKYYKQAMRAFLRPVVMYSPSTGYADYHARALVGAAICFDKIRPFLEDELLGPKYKGHAASLYGQAASMYPNSVHGQDAKNGLSGMD